MPPITHSHSKIIIEPLNLGLGADFRAPAAKHNRHGLALRPTTD